MIYKGRGLLQDKRQERDTYKMKEKESNCNVKSIGSELKRSARGNNNSNGSTDKEIYRRKMIIYNIKYMYIVISLYEH